MMDVPAVSNGSTVAPSTSSGVVSCGPACAAGAAGFAAGADVPAFAISAENGSAAGAAACAAGAALPFASNAENGSLPALDACAVGGSPGICCGIDCP